MKAIYIGTENYQNDMMADLKKDDAFNKLLNEYTIMESHIIYFSAGDASIKEILIKKEPTYSV
jgi:hypothetical protein